MTFYRVVVGNSKIVVEKWYLVTNCTYLHTRILVIGPLGQFKSSKMSVVIFKFTQYVKKFQTTLKNIPYLIYIFSNLFYAVILNLK